MLVVGILGSPRLRSNTGLLVERVLAGAGAAGADTELIRLRSLKFESCRHCGGCDQTGRCVVQDDMQQLYPKLRAAQHVVVASPVQFSGVSGQTKAMVDRMQCCWVQMYRLRRTPSDLAGQRRGVFIATCGGKDRRVFDWAAHTVRAFFNSTGFVYWGELFEPETDKDPPVAKRKDLLDRAQALGRQLLEE
jgi:multimeric flavodoxin WrbA